MYYYGKTLLNSILITAEHLNIVLHLFVSYICKAQYFKAGFQD